MPAVLKSVHARRVKDNRRQLVPFFSTISILNISTKLSRCHRVKNESACQPQLQSQDEGASEGVSSEMEGAMWAHAALGIGGLRWHCGRMQGLSVQLTTSSHKIDSMSMCQSNSDSNSHCNLHCDAVVMGPPCY